MGFARVLRESKVREVNVEVGDCRFSSEATHRFVASCVGADLVVAVRAPQIGMSACLRFAFADSRRNRDLAQKNPWLFADTGISQLLGTLRKCGANNRNIQVQAIGAANFYGEEGQLPEGKRNELALRKTLWAEGVLLNGTDLGGALDRTVWFDGLANRLLVRSEERRMYCIDALPQHKAS